MNQMLDNESYRHPAQGLEQFPPQMTLRDWFAGQIMGGMWAKPDEDAYYSPDIDYAAAWASTAYRYADAMMKQREVKNDQ